MMDDFDTDFFCKACGQYFAHLNAYSSHFSSCRKGKRKMASALEVAKESYKIIKSRLQVASSSASYPVEVSEGRGGSPSPFIGSAAILEFPMALVRYRRLVYAFLLLNYFTQCVDRPSSNS